jgi:hypothetical protein
MKSGTPGPLASRAMVAVAIITLVIAACSTGPLTTGTGSTDNENAAHGQALRFAACMRDNGLRDFPDPDSSGEFTIEQIANGSSVDTNSAAFSRALIACKDLEPAGFTGSGRTPEQQAAALKFAQCIRDNGVKDFPDPGIDDPLVDTNRIPSSDTQAGLAILNAAMKKCGDFAGAAGVTGP